MTAPRPLCSVAGGGLSRRPLQAKLLDDEFQMDFVLNVDVPFETIEQRLTARWCHMASGARRPPSTLRPHRPLRRQGGSTTSSTIRPRVRLPPPPRPLAAHPRAVAGLDDETGEPLEQREDDKPETVQARLKCAAIPPAPSAALTDGRRLYEEETKPLIEHYSQQGLVENFRGTESDVIYPMIHAHLEKLGISAK